MPPRTQTPYNRSPLSPIMVSIVSDEDDGWWLCQPQKGSVSAPVADTRYATIPCYWSCSATQPIVGKIMYATQLATSNEWVLSPRCCDDTEAAD